MKTTDDLFRAVLAILPDATLDEDNYGQIIIYTNKQEDENGNLKNFVLPCDACDGEGTTGGTPNGGASPCDVCNGTGYEPQEEKA